MKYDPDISWWDSSIYTYRLFQNPEIDQKHRTLGQDPRNSCFLSTAMSVTGGTWWISLQFLWWGQMFNCRTLAPILTVSKSYYFSASLTGCYSNEGLWAGRGSWTNAGDCSLNTSSCERTMSSLRPTEPGRYPDTRCTSQCEWHVELTLVLCTSLKRPIM